MEPQNEVPEEIKHIHDVWKKLYHRWWALHYSIGLVGTIAAITVASNPEFLLEVPFALDILAWVSAVSVAVITFLEPKKRARAYVAAWRLIHQEMGEFRYGEAKSVKTLFATVQEGEAIIERLDS